MNAQLRIEDERSVEELQDLLDLANEQLRDANATIERREAVIKVLERDCAELERKCAEKDDMMAHGARLNEAAHAELAKACKLTQVQDTLLQAQRERIRELREALIWNAAVLKELCNGNISESSTSTINGETKSFGEILDMADAALNQQEKV